MNNEKFDQWFDDAFDNAATSSSLSSDESKKESWKKVQLEIHKHNKSTKRMRHFQLAAVVAASVAAGAIIFNPPAITQAISPMYSSVKDWGNVVVEIIFSTNTRPSLEDAKTSAPPNDYPEDEENPSATLDRVVQFTSKVLTLEEVQNEISFAYPNFRNIPDRFHLVSSELPPDTSAVKSDQLTMTYRTDNNETMRILLQSTINMVGTTSSGSPDTEILTLDNEIEAYYTPGRFNDIKFMYNGLLIGIYGNVTKEELLQMAESLPK